MKAAHRSSLFLLGIATAALLLLAAPAAAQPSPEVRAAWGFDRSDLPPHPAVRFGMLPNGMRYAIMRNAEPAEGLSIRLRFDVGSTAEGEDERGMMHVLEHMIFEGSRRLPHRRLLDLLAANGLRRPGHFNAATQPHDTLYRLDLVRSGPEALDAGLMVMEEISEGLLLSPTLVERAKLRVRAELEARSVGERIADAQTAFFMPGTPISERPVHGTIGELRRVTAPRLRRLYRRVYAPQRATLILVGDLDPDAAEAAVAARFGDWQFRPSPLRQLLPRIDPARPSEVRHFIDPEAPTEATIAAVAPLPEDGDAAAPRDRAFLAHLGCRMLARRLQRLAAAADGPIASGDCAAYDHFATARVARVDVTAGAGDWRGALSAGSQALRAALNQGFTSEELEEQVAAMRPAAGSSAERSSAGIADAIAASLQAGTIYTRPQDPSEFADYLARVRIEEVNAAFRAAWQAVPARLLFISHNAPIADPPAGLE